MQALAVGDKDRFMAVELEERRLGEMPPFGRLAALILAGGDAERVKDEAAGSPEPRRSDAGAIVLGPAPAPLALLRGRYRERLLVKAGPGLDLPAWLRGWLGAGEAARRGPAPGGRGPDELSSRPSASSTFERLDPALGWRDGSTGRRRPVVAFQRQHPAPESHRLGRVVAGAGHVAQARARPPAAPGRG